MVRTARKYPSARLWDISLHIQHWTSPNKQQAPLQIHSRTIRSSSPFVHSPWWLTSISHLRADNMCGCQGYRSAPWWTAKNYLEINTGYIMYSKKSHLLCYDDSTSMVLKREGKRRGGRQHKGPLFSGRDKSEVSVWTFNILQGTKRSYSGLVSEFFFWAEGFRGLLCVSVNCCMLLSQLLCGFAWVASTKTWEINQSAKKYLLCQMWHLEKKGLRKTCLY